MSSAPEGTYSVTPCPFLNFFFLLHYCDVIIGAAASQITSLTIVYSIDYSDADQWKHQSSASLAFVRGIHRGPVNSPHKGPVTRKMFPMDDVIMTWTNDDPFFWRRLATSGHKELTMNKGLTGSQHRFRLQLNDQGLSALTHWGRDKMAAIFQTTLSNAFSWMKMLKFRLKFNWSLFLRVQLTIVHHWFRRWLGTDQATSHYLNQWWLDYWRIYICVTRPQWVNSMAEMQRNRKSDEKHPPVWIVADVNLMISLLPRTQGKTASNVCHPIIHNLRDARISQSFHL